MDTEIRLSESEVYTGQHNNYKNTIDISISGVTWYFMDNNYNRLQCFSFFPLVICLDIS